MKNRLYFQIIFRLLLLLINSAIIFFSIEKKYLINTIGFLLLLLFQCFLLITFFKKLLADVEKSIDCMLYNDFSNTFSAKKRENQLYNKTALLMEKHKKQQLQKTSEQLIFTNIIESLTIGILILKKDADNTISIFQMNQSFVNFLKIPRYYQWNLLRKKMGNMTHFINQWKTTKQTVTLTVNGNNEDFFLKTACTQTHRYDYLVVTLETIQQLINKKEKEAWYKLMNVMSHEIINTITPISSLAENLDSLLQEENTDEDTLDELSEGLQIIKKRSHHLTSFVDTYRKLAELPLPNKEKISLTNIVKNTLKLYKQEFAIKNIATDFTVKKPFLINADKQQMEQILINLISNSLFALEKIKKPLIKIDIKKENNQIYLQITDNGIGIANKIKESIFVPYFTTRKNGSGIGLTLTKSIIEAHKGSIYFHSTKERTTFTVVFITE